MSDRLAAALLLTRGSGPEMEVFLAERNQKLRFFGGYWALPGGTVDAADGEDGAAAMHACARRELFEETGLLWQRLSEERSREELTALRTAMTKRDAEGGGSLSPPLVGEPLRELCRIQTPEFAPVRYDTVFFHVPLEECAAGTAEAEPEIWPGELTDGRFMRPIDALTAWRRGELSLVPPIVIVLEHIEDAAGDIEGFASTLTATADEYRQGRLHRVRFSPGIVLAALRTPTLPPATTTNCYVVGNERLFVIDPGSPNADEQQRLNGLLDELEADGAEIAGILLTHHHQDHVGGVTALSRARSLPVHGHPLTLKRVPQGFIVGDEIEDGCKLPLGDAPDGAADWHLTAIHTPGHDRGHLCFRESRYGALIAGDMLSTVSTIIIDPPEGHLATYMDSLDRLATGPITTLYPAHGPAMRDGRRLINQYIRHRRQRESALIAALQEDGGTVEELVPKIYWDADPELYPFASRSLQAGLEKLAEEGRATTDGLRWSARTT